MKLNKILKNVFLITFACLALSACATSKKTSGQMQGDVYTGTDTVEYLASGVPDRVFFATNESVLTTASRETLRAQAGWLRKNPSINVVLEGHADERGTREYNLALGERRANAAKDYLMTYGGSDHASRAVCGDRDNRAHRRGRFHPPGASPHGYRGGFRQRSHRARA